MLLVYRLGSALTFGVERRFPPSVQQMQALVAFAAFHRVGRVHRDAEGATVDLGGPQLDELEQRLLDAA